jgi:arylsulfatase A-like enzyme
LLLFASAAALLAAVLEILANIDGWLFYDDWRELCTEIGARLLIALLLAAGVASLITFLCVPFIARSPRSSERVEAISRPAALLTVLLCCCIAVGILIRWALAVNLLRVTDQTSIDIWDAACVLLLLTTAAWYAFAQQRQVLMDRLVGSLSGRMTRRWVLAAGLGGLVTGFSNRLDARPGSRRATRPAAQKAPDIVLVSFDALCAEDMSCYGYGLPTTPNIDALARGSHVFSNFYTASTFTTPCVASMMTGRYPSSLHVYNYGARLPGAMASDTLPRVLHDCGYSTGASVANPGAHPACLGFGGHFDVLPPPPVLDWSARDCSMLFRSAELATDVARGVTFFPYMMEHLSSKRFGQLHSKFPPELSFRQATRVLEQLPRPFFLWVHVFAPHFPYLPDPPFLHRFLAGEQLRTHAEFVELLDRKGLNYSAAKQLQVNNGRLRYDEWIAQSDAAFGEFVGGLKSSGRFDNLALVVSSDHGESFSGGFLGHGDSGQRRPVLHVPLLIRLPGQTPAYDIATVADQTALAPTLLAIAGQQTPDWMQGKALSLQASAPDAEGLAFTQHLAPNHAQGPVRRGTVGAIDGRYQYVFDLDSRRGGLYNLAQAHEREHDLAGAEPEVAARLLATMRSRFPEVTGLA